MLMGDKWKNHSSILDKMGKYLACSVWLINPVYICSNSESTEVTEKKEYYATAQYL
jgi:hypothetical protein